MPEPEFLTATRNSYDEVAETVAEAWRRDLDVKPWDRAALAVFAELVGPGGRVADVGCGTGRVTAWLAARGLDVFGIDLSPGMLAVARRDHPELSFSVGDMTDLQLPADSLDGLLAFYSIIHVPPARLPDVFAGFARALAPRGHLLVVFQTGDGVVHYAEGYGHCIDLHFHRRTCAEVANLAEGAGLVVSARLEREAVERHERTPQGYVLARKPDAGIS
ncbi:class I SAM-dependent DNA methyltransferase [Sporichthya polymorpha]|uniref:class I SAM-dependent DNA methyltransferase n=1 Tax=Sporichthya polymorpha TaxID=35751 RepID=UPI00036EF9D1|nr:class I SAM-dependent methyltransferase [Sporichthya polymorpha]